MSYEFMAIYILVVGCIVAFNYRVGQILGRSVHPNEDSKLEEELSNLKNTIAKISVKVGFNSEGR